MIIGITLVRNRLALISWVLIIPIRTKPAYFVVFIILLAVSIGGVDCSGAFPVFQLVSTIARKAKTIFLGFAQVIGHLASVVLNDEAIVTF